MKKSIRTCFAILAIAAICLPLSCIRETAPEDELIDKNLTISFRAGQAEDIKVTKSSIEDVMAEIKPLDASVENAEEVAMATAFHLQVTEQSLDDELFADAKEATKGTPVYTENLGAFKATAYLSGAQYNTPFLAEAEYAKVNGVWSHTYTDDIKWPEGQELAFFMRYPGDDSSAGWNYTNAEVNSVRVNRIEHLSYVTPGSGEGVTNAAEQQTDFVFATTTLSESDLDKTNKILFYHPFAGVKFKVGAMPEGLVIKSITLGNVIGNGRCVVTPYYGNTDDYNATNSNRVTSADATKSANCVEWNLTYGTRTSFTQAFTAADKGTTPTSSLFPSDFSTLGGSTLPNQNQLNNANLSKTFILIPQTFDDSNKLTLNIEFEYKGITLTRSASTTATWLAGSLYTYTIKFNSNIDVTITDEVNASNTKQNVVITNTGNVPEYIRAAIVGNWFLNGDIVAPWDMTSANGSFVGLPGDDGSNGKWVRSGRYYYFNKPVAPDAATPAPLFTSYTPVTIAPVSGSHLEMKIMVQAIIADDTVANSAWGVKPSELN